MKLEEGTSCELPEKLHLTEVSTPFPPPHLQSASLPVTVHLGRSARIDCKISKHFSFRVFSISPTISVSLKQKCHTAILEHSSSLNNNNKKTQNTVAGALDKKWGAMDFISGTKQSSLQTDLNLWRGDKAERPEIFLLTAVETRVKESGSFWSN